MSRIISSALSASLLVLWAGSALAADPLGPGLIAAPRGLPAVSGVNAKIGAFGGVIDDQSGFGFLGSVSVPLAFAFGAQADAIAGSAGGNSFWGVGGHLFWRDPGQGLLGVYGSYVDWQPFGAQVTKVGVEGEWYSGPLTLAGFVGGQTGDFTGIASNATVAYYLNANLRLDATFRHLEGLGNSFGVGGEWQSDFSGLAVFANGAWADSSHSTFVAGVKFYTGAPKTLIRRHREDDPLIELPFNLFQKPNVCQQQQTQALTEVEVPICEQPGLG